MDAERAAAVEPTQECKNSTQQDNQQETCEKGYYSSKRLMFKKD